MLNLKLNGEAFLPETALVTGGTAGIGKVVTMALLRNGLNVAVCARRGVENLAEEAAQMGLEGKVFGFRMDLCDRDSISRAIDEIARQPEFPSLGAIINCAGKCSFYPDPADPLPHPKDEADLERIWLEDDNVGEEMLRLNLLGPYRVVTRAWLRNLIVRESVIVSITSISGRAGGRNAHATYSAAKGGMHALTKQWAKMFGPVGARANAIAPGAILGTEMTAGWDRERQIEPMIRATLTGALSTAEQIADTVLYMLSNGNLTGQTIDHNGGAHMV